VLRALAGLLVLILAGQVFAEACNFRDHDLSALPDSSNGPVEIDILLYLNNLTEIEDAQQSFVSDVFIRAEWIDSRLAHSGLIPCTVDDALIWTPGLMLLNRRALERVYDPELSVAPNGRVIKVLRAYGEFTFQADLSDFPFDHQELYFTLISKYEVQEVNVVTSPQKLGMAEHLSVANWQIQLGGSRSSEHYVAPVDRIISRLDIIFHAQRLSGFYTWQLLVPLFLVVMMTWTVFWIPLEFVPPRVGLVATAMLTLIAYRFAIASILPPIAYLTRLDKFMVASSVLVFAALAAVVAVTYFDGRDSKVQALWLNKASRALAPLLFMIVFIKVFLM
jgi:gamma-aminobutyric acid receptor subunit beta